MMIPLADVKVTGSTILKFLSVPELDSMTKLYVGWLNSSFPKYKEMPQDVAKPLTMSTLSSYVSGVTFSAVCPSHDAFKALAYLSREAKDSRDHGDLTKLSVTSSEFDKLVQADELDLIWRAYLKWKETCVFSKKMSDSEEEYVTKVNFSAFVGGITWGTMQSPAALLDACKLMNKMAKDEAGTEVLEEDDDDDDDEPTVDTDSFSG